MTTLISIGRSEPPGDELAEIDELLVGLQVPPADWDILYRLRLQAERDVLRERPSS